MDALNVSFCAPPRPALPLAFARFCDAILNYISNIDRATDKTITVARFSQSMYSAFEVLFNVWLNAKEVKVGCLLPLFLLRCA